MGRHRSGVNGLARPGPVVLLSAVAAVVLALLAGPGASPAGADTGTYVRLAQLAPDMQGVAMTVTSAADPSRLVTLPATAYGGLSDYRRLDPGDYVVTLRPDGSTGPPAITTALKASAGTSYTLAAVGGTSGLTVVVDDLTPPPAGQARVRVIDAAPGDPALDVRGPGSADFATGLVPGALSPYRTVAAGRLALAVGPPGGPVTTLPVAVAANQIVSVVLVRNAGRLEARPHLDATGPATPPPGPVDAGYGGAAVPHGPLGAVLLGALAVGAAGLSTLRARRAGRPSRT